MGWWEVRIEEWIASRGRRQEKGGHSISGPFSVGTTEWVLARGENIYKGDKETQRIQYSIRAMTVYLVPRIIIVIPTA